ncbi:UNVERIFIED_CONTAM: hypothetical protein ABID98_002094 [Brevibacillus sp. OAP136]
MSGCRRILTLNARKATIVTQVLLIILVSILLSGCMYPKERRAENQVPSTFYLEATQKAIDQFHQETGVLPIVTKKLDTPIFEKYEIDFTKMMPKYIPDVPANAFEKGGVYMYVLIDVETKPTVRLINLSMVSQLADVQQAVNRYVGSKNQLPTKQELGNGYYTIDYDAIRMKEVQVNSLVSQTFLPLIMNEKGDVGIDYASDIASILRSTKAQVPKDTDPRYVMARESMFVPAKSFPYTMENGDPVLLKLQ